ncbi:hypothetical protein HMI54_007588 [Coelomomyces lativittatus]|nr:hypothetical protein HMI55_004112 [Coelomomyces lativittatus]KAJ1512808.1 hypothetical protein HMI56_003507 [Coelomomyces lativittatus]KAJ1516952.1 hypothetical protein HMI54_007588 [Coelomomyces lativittatus]
MPPIKSSTLKKAKPVVPKSLTVRGRGRRKQISPDISIPSTPILPKTSLKNRRKKKSDLNVSTDAVVETITTPKSPKKVSSPKNTVIPSKAPKLEVVLPPISPIKKTPDSSPDSSPDSPTPKSKKKGRVSISDQLLIENTYSKIEYDRSPIINGRVEKSKSKAKKINIRKLLQKAKVTSKSLSENSSTSLSLNERDLESKNTSPYQFFAAMANAFTDTLSGAFTSLIGHPMVAYSTDEDALDDELYI